MTRTALPTDPGPHQTTVTARYQTILINDPVSPVHVLHIYGPTRRERADALADARTIVVEPHLVREHWHIETRSVLRTIHIVPAQTVPLTKRDKALAAVSHLALAAALAFIAGCIYYAMAVN